MIAFTIGFLVTTALCWAWEHRVRLRHLARRMFRCAFGHHRSTVDTDYSLLAYVCVDCERTEVIGPAIFNGTNQRHPAPKRRKR